MNGDTSLLLATVLREQPCVDPSLQSTVQSVPFAVKCMAQQGYYTLYLISVVRALLNNEPSAYVYIIHRLQELDELHRDVQLGRASLVSSPAQADTVIGVHVEQTGNVLEALPNIPAGSERIFYSLSDVVRAVPCVSPASSLELRVVLVGGGTVGRCFLQTILDEHPRLVHPNRITVITRQPETLAHFTARGVLCVDRKHGRQAINQCDVLIVALQSHQVQEFAKQHFATKLPGADLDPPARLQPSCLVLSCVAGMPRAKLAQLFHHPQKLIVQPEVPTPGAIDSTAKMHEMTLKNATDLQIQSMADHDSFLHSAVVEAEDIHVLNIADEIVSKELASGGRGDSVSINVPVEVARRRAVAAATAAAKAPYAVPRISEVLLQNVFPPDSFLLAVWHAVRSYAAVQLAEARQRDHKANRDKSSSEGTAAATSVLGSGGRAAHHRGGKKLTSSVASDAAESDGPFLCAAFAALPASAVQPLTRATLQLHGAPEVEGDYAAEAHVELSAGPETATVSRKEQAGAADGAQATATVALRRRMPDRYADAAAVGRDLQQRYLAILRDQL